MIVIFLVEERRLPSHLPGRLDFRQRLSIPEIAEQLDRRWPITCVVIIGKSQNHDEALMDLLKQSYPFRQFVPTIAYTSVPCLRLLHDTFPVHQTPNVSVI